MQQPEITILDDNQEMLGLLSSFLEMSLPVSCLTLSTFHAIKENLDVVLRTQITILDIELGYNQPSGIDAYQLLVQNNYKGRIFFLTGHGHTHPLAKKAIQSNCIVWEKPMDLEVIARTLKEVILT